MRDVFDVSEVGEIVVDDVFTPEIFGTLRICKGLSVSNRGGRNERQENEMEKDPEKEHLEPVMC